jgi:response regulator of citrate/malate metabolism
LPEFVVEWDYPLMRLAKELNPEALRRPQAKNKVCTDLEFIKTVLTHEPQGTAAISAKAEHLGFSRRTTERYLQRLKDAGVISYQYGTYWRNHEQNN